jgi:acyl carrier protein
MIATAIEPWTGILAGIDSRALDCLQANLAVLADRCHGTGTYVRLGSAAGFAPRFDGELPIADPGVGGRLAEAAAAGLRVAERSDVDPAGAGERADEAPVYLVADAFTLPWLPYFETRHIEHSFLLTRGGDDYLVVDAYHIDTPNGAARPGVWSLTADEIDAALAGGAHAVRLVAEPFDPVPRPASNRSLVDAYVDAYRDHPDRAEALDRLCAETWTLARQRRLAALAGQRRLAALAGERRPAGDAPADVAAWDRLAEEVYLAWRRVDRGRAEPTGWVDSLRRLLAADCVGDAADAALPADVAVDAVVRDAIADVLATDPAAVTAADSLADLPGFSSFRLVDIIERVEQALGVELSPGDLVAESLHRLDRLTALFEAAAGREALSHA